MVSTSALREDWDHLRKQILLKWSQFTDEELQNFNGSADELISHIQQKTGENRESIQEFLKTTSEEGTTMINRVKEQLGDGVSAAREKAEHLAEQARDGYQRMQSRVGETVQDRPGISLAAAFGLGVLVGVGLSLLLIDSEPEPLARRYSRNAEKQGRRFLSALAESLPESISHRIS